ncbi:MAG TPA: DUF4350 domain-containing protein [Pyrinomonadaceae bacterium]
MTPRRMLVAIVLLVAAYPASAQQMADPEFSTSVEHPAYNKTLPRVLFDEAHNNFHTTTGRYKPFVDLISNDGYRVVANRQAFTEKVLGTFRILIIANALGAEEMDDEGADHSAFTDQECDAVRDWVRSGGNLLLIADHAPFGSAAENLASRFGVKMSKGFTFDRQNSESGNVSTLIFSRDNKLLLDHPITTGRSAAERIGRVVTFTGQSLKGPARSAVILQLADSARDQADRTSTTNISVAGWAQGIALKEGKGRVVMLGEAAMLSAQLAGPSKFKMGMNYPGTDNKQFALNIMHWLSGLLRDR